MHQALEGAYVASLAYSGEQGAWILRSCFRFRKASSRPANRVKKLPPNAAPISGKVAPYSQSKASVTEPPTRAERSSKIILDVPVFIVKLMTI
jgi:hypothetical protein